jgi:hypothetical protein
MPRDGSAAGSTQISAAEHQGRVRAARLCGALEASSTLLITEEQALRALTGHPCDGKRLHRRCGNSVLCQQRTYVIALPRLKLATHVNDAMHDDNTPVPSFELAR